MRAYEVREAGRLVYVDRDGAVVRRTDAKAELHVANYVGALEIDVPRPATQDGKSGYLGPDGSFLAPPAYDGATPFVDGRAFVGTRVGYGSRGVAILQWRMVDAALAPMGDLAFAEIHGFGDGVAPARAFAEPQRWGLVGRDGAWQSPPQWDWLGPICEQRAAAKSGGKYGFIDATGTWVVEPRYDLVTDFARGMAQVALADGASPALSTDDAGRIVITPHFSGAFGIVDRAGALLHPVTSRAPVLGLRGGQELSEGRAVIQHERRYGYADLQGRVVIAAQYDYALPFSEGRARVRRGKKEGFVDLDGAEIVAAIYDGALPFSEGLAAVKKKQWGYIDRDGNVLIAPRFGPVSEFKDGRALVWIDKTRMGLLAPDGRLVWEET